jgi:hypothetical protein
MHPNYHANKYNICKSKGIRLFTIFADEWEYKQDIVIKALRHKFHKNTNDVIFARKCTVVNIDTSTKDVFLNTYHMQGTGPGSLTYGLVDPLGKLVAVVTFIRQQHQQFVLNRYATASHVVGGFSKLLKHFESNNTIYRIITFADLRWSEGQLYTTNGFTQQLTQLPPDYQYIIGNKRYHKFGFRHKLLPKKLQNYDPNITEIANCEANNIYRIYDCGKLKFIKEVNNYVPQ